ncbi:hypothetical protein BST81_03170 [Leptolyngbya sp. 'hensonii']|uniref:ATP-binding protein n=1 Tax=Leptolyngbya sp. 'hensonii' TaxID=1922337 RepID=UPI00094F5B95|nr:ATP-binding protein [Leptolyngbya sp. 'hensonii']OLP19906.1 hypothetical protein BST81_03170 [Leptolyngbya sp. 'hensonii']
MDEVAVLHQINQLVKTKTGEALTPLQRRIFQSAYQGYTYEEMPGIWSREGNFRVDYNTTSLRDEGRKLWALLSDILDIPIRKTRLGFRDSILEGLQRLDAQKQSLHHQPSTNFSPPLVQADKTDSEFCFEDDDGECGEIRWVGRQALLETVSQRLQADCRILSLEGITGIGKTTLALRLLKDTSLWPEGTCGHKILLTRQSPSFETLVQTLLPDQDSQLMPQKDSEQWLRAMIHALQTRPHLLVLDMVEEIMQSDAQGQFRFIDPLYEAFFMQMASAKTMPSRIILTSQDQPPICPEGRYPDRWLQQPVRGFTEVESLQLFRQWDISIQMGDETCLKKIIQIYEGHPLALRVIIGELRSAYQGDVQLFWQEHGPDIEEMLRLRETDRGEGSAPSLPLYGTSRRLVVEVRRRVEKTFLRLQRDHPIAFELICQGSIFYKPAERERWLQRIRHYPAEQQKLAFEVLQQRFLLEKDTSYRPYRYRLHSLIQSVAETERQRLEEEL